MFDMNQVNNNEYPHLPWKIIDDPTPHPEGESAIRALLTNTNWRYGAETDDIPTQATPLQGTNNIQYPRNAAPDQPLFENGSTSLIKGLLLYLFNYLQQFKYLGAPVAAVHNAATAPETYGYSFILARARGSYFKSNQNLNRPPCQITFDKLLADELLHINIANRLLKQIQIT